MQNFCWTTLVTKWSQTSEIDGSDQGASRLPCAPAAFQTNHSVILTLTWSTRLLYALLSQATLFSRNKCGTCTHLNLVNNSLGFIFNFLHGSLYFLSRLGTNCHLLQHLNKSITDKLRCNNHARQKVLACVLGFEESFSAYASREREARFALCVCNFFPSFALSP